MITRFKAIQGGAERIRPCGWRADYLPNRSLHRHRILTANTFRRSLKFLFCAVITVIIPLHADELSTSWDIRVTAVDILPGLDTIWLRSGPSTKPIPVALNIRTFSQPIRYKGPAKAAFFRDETEASLDEPPAALASANLTQKESLIIFSPRADGSGYQTMVIGDSDFPFGSFRFVNGSGIAAQVEIDGKKTSLKNLATETMTFQETKKSLAVRIMTAKSGEAPRLIRQSAWSIDLAQRELIFLMPGSAPGLVMLRHFIDSKTE
jgi:hypothetical protein